MAKTFVVCSILADEVEKAVEELGLSNRIHYIEAALHVNLDKLEHAIVDNLEGLQAAGTQSALIVGTKCHPDIRKIAERYHSGIICGSNCIEMLLGEEKLRELDSECNTFYITGGWLKNWHAIFCEGGMGWDSIDARMNFGRYERILLLDAGLSAFTDEEVYAFFEFTEVPIETYPITLDHLKKRILELLD